MSQQPNLTSTALVRKNLPTSSGKPFSSNDLRDSEHKFPELVRSDRTPSSSTAKDHKDTKDTKENKDKKHEQKQFTTTDLAGAIFTRNAAQVKRILDSNPILALGEIEGTSFLFLTCIYFHEEVSALQKRLDEIDQKLNFGRNTPAQKQSLTQSLNKLIAGAEPSKQTLLTIIQLLLKGGADINKEHPHLKITPVHFVCQKSYPQILHLFFNYSQTAFNTKNLELNKYIPVYPETKSETKKDASETKGEYVVAYDVTHATALLATINLFFNHLRNQKFSFDTNDFRKWAKHAKSCVLTHPKLQPRILNLLGDPWRDPACLDFLANIDKRISILQKEFGVIDLRSAIRNLNLKQFKLIITTNPSLGSIEEEKTQKTPADWVCEHYSTLSSSNKSSQLTQDEMRNERIIFLMLRELQKRGINLIGVLLQACKKLQPRLVYVLVELGAKFDLDKINDYLPLFKIEGMEINSVRYKSDDKLSLTIISQLIKKQMDRDEADYSIPNISCWWCVAHEVPIAKSPIELKSANHGESKKDFDTLDLFKEGATEQTQRLLLSYKPLLEETSTHFNASFALTRTTAQKKINECKKNRSLYH